jgi:hypothetical protein
MTRSARGKNRTVAVLNFPAATRRMAKGKLWTLIAHPIRRLPYLLALTFAPRHHGPQDLNQP